MSNRFVAFALVLFLAFPCACSSHKSGSAVNENNRPSDNNSTPPQKMERSMSDRDSTPSQKVERPQVKKRTIGIAGKEQEFTLTLFDSSELVGFPLPFTTYLPPDVVADTASSGEGAAVRFTANFDGTRNEDALVSVFYHPGQTTEAEVRREFKFVGRESKNLRERSSGILMHYRWSLMEYDFVPSKDGGLVGTVALGHRGGRFFTVMLRYPEGQEEEFAPRGRLILEEFRWKDTGQGLK
jgi:hypothetical protein